MTSFEPIPLLSALREADNIDAQISALRAIKNNITGHELRKIEYVRGGLIPVLVRTLQHTQPSTASHVLAESSEDKLWIHAVNILGAIAYGGPSFVQPLLHSTAIATLLAQLSFTSAQRLTLAILRCLNVIADNLPLASPDDWAEDRRLANALYMPAHVARFANFISEASVSGVSQQTCDAALSLICKTCVDDKQKTLLVRAGVLSALGDRLASFVVAEGLVIPGIDVLGNDQNPLPPAAPSNAHLSPVLETLGLLIDSSKNYAYQLLTNTTIVAVLPSKIDDFSPSDIRRNPWGATYLSGGAIPRSRGQTPLDLLLPHVPEFERAESTDNFPPLGTDVSFSRRRPSAIRPMSELPSTPIIEESAEYQEGSLLVPWLLYIVRTYRGKRRVLAGRVLVAIFKHGLVSPLRTRAMRALLAPLLVQMIDSKIADDDDRSLLLTKISYLKVAPSVLGKLIMDDEQLQKVTVDSGAIAKLSACLKNTFEVPTEKASLWRPWVENTTIVGESIECCLGPGGPSLQERHTMLHREGLLQALAAIAPFNDNYRTQICEQGALTQIMLALEPFHSEATVKEDGDPAVTTSGNSASTLLAACDAVRALTRSVTTLRTKLVDAEVAKAIVKLLHTSDPEVTIAATRVLVNLAVDFSPMKGTVSEPALVKKLCEQAHSANARLRLESVWALKHLVLKSSNKLKRDVIDELGVNWIRHLIATDPHNIPPGDVIGLVEKDYPPRSSHYAGTGDVIMSEDSDDEDAVTVETVRDTSTYTRHTVEDDLAIQEQLLDLLRNLFCGENAPEIIEYILGDIGYPEFMKIIMDRLKPRTTNGATRKANQTLTAPPRIVDPTLHIIVHIAACQTKFRNMVTQNLPLLRQILTFYQSPDRRIRGAVCWIAINLTYGENPADKEACRTRAFELNKAGYLSHVRRMETDVDLDVRERAKTAVLLLEKLIPKEIQR